MDVRNCRKCRKIFNYIGGPLFCPACRDALEAKFQEVKKYVYTNKGATVPQIAQDCEVEVAQIQQWIREERLVFADDSPIGISCETCGAMIKTGRFCEACKAQMTNTLNSVRQRPQPQLQQPAKREKESPKMRFLN